MKNIYLIPTDKPSNLFLGTRTNKLYIIPIGDIGIPQHIYITSDEEPKHLDYYITKITDSNGERYVVGQRLDINDSDYSNCKKIILTTDQNLIKDGIQAIDDEFLEWFIKNPTCEYVEIYRDFIYTSTTYDQPDRLVGVKYSAIIPQEEPKQETLEEIPQDYCPPKDLANAIWGTCFKYQDLEKNGIKDKIRNACFIIEKIYKNEIYGNERTSR